MKLKIASAAVLAAFCGAASAQVSVYGLIDASYGKSIDLDINGKKSEFHSGGDNGSSEGNSTTRVGVKGSYDLGGGTKANFRFETNGITSEGKVNDTFFKRAAWVGFSGNLGEVRLGRQTTVAFNTLIDYDLNGASNGVSAQAYSQVAQWIWRAGRDNGLLQYISPDMGGVTVRAGYLPQGNRVTDASDLPKLGTPKDVLSLGLTYAKGPLSVSATFEGKRTTKGTDYSAVAASYDFGPVKLMASMDDGGKNKKGTTLGLSAPVAGATVGFITSRNSDTKGSGTEVFINKEIFKNTIAYAEFGSVNKAAVNSYVNTVTPGVAAPNKSASGSAVGVIFVF